MSSVANKLIQFYLSVKEYLFNTTWIFIEKILNIFITFFIAVLLARYLGPSSYGILAFSLSLISIFEVIAHFGLSGLVVRELVNSDQQSSSIMGTSFLIKSITSGISFIVYLFCIFLVVNTRSVEFFVSLILSFKLFFIAFNVIDSWFQSKVISKYVTISRTVGVVVYGVVVIFLILMEAGLFWFAIANVLQVATASLFLVLFYKKLANEKISDWKISIPIVKSLSSQSSLVFLGSVFAVIYLKIDQVMLKWLLGNKEVGIYAIAANISEAWYFMPVALVSSIFPGLLKVRFINPSLYKIRLQQLFDLLLSVALVASIIVALCSDFIISTFFGDDYLASSLILKIHIWASLFVFMRAVFSKWILIENLLFFSMWTHGLGAVINILLNLYFIRNYGGAGAAVATVISYAAASYFSLVFYKKTRKVFVMMSLAFVAPIRYIYSIVNGFFAKGI